MKKTLLKLLCLVLALTLLCGCTPSVDETVEALQQLGQSPDDHYRTWYEIFVYSFCDSNGDGIGDLRVSPKSLIICRKWASPVSG